ncbi:hypothetical protein ACS0TY_009117 [Phlomoides rotata]
MGVVNKNKIRANNSRSKKNSGTPYGSLDKPKVSSMASKRILKELKNLQKDPPTSRNAGIPQNFLQSRTYLHGLQRNAGTS